MVTTILMTTSTCRASSADVQPVPGVHGVTLDCGVEAWFTGADVAGTDDANLAHHRPHVPERLSAARDVVGAATRTDPSTWHLMRQVHGADVATVTTDVPSGAELRQVDVIVTVLPDRPLVVLAADCLPILAAGRHAIGAAHAGWRGIVADVPGSLVAALTSLGEDVADLRIAIGPAIGPCCYEVGDEVRDTVGRVAPGALTTTRGGTSSVDLRTAARVRFASLGVVAVQDVGAAGGTTSECTACGSGWFSHRRDPSSGRQAGIIVRRGEDRPGSH
jgi:polyphenol oxidase